MGRCGGNGDSADIQPSERYRPHMQRVSGMGSSAQTACRWLVCMHVREHSLSPPAPCACACIAVRTGANTARPVRELTAQDSLRRPVQHSRWAAPAALHARRAMASSSPRARVRLRLAPWGQSTVALAHTRRIPMGATGTPSPAASTSTRTRPAWGTLSRKLYAAVRRALPLRRSRSR